MNTALSEPRFSQLRSLLVGQRDQAHLVLQLGRAVCLYIYMYGATTDRIPDISKCELFKMDFFRSRHCQLQAFIMNSDEGKEPRRRRECSRERHAAERSEHEEA